MDPASLQSALQLTTTTTTMDSTTSSVGAAATSTIAIVCGAVHCLVSREEPPLTATTERRKRHRLLTEYQRQPLPEAFAALVAAVDALNEEFTPILSGADEIFPRSQPTRAARLQVQASIREVQNRIENAKGDLEDALNRINDNDDDDDDGNEKEEAEEETAELTKLREETYGACDRLYHSIALPRIQVCEALLLCRVALTIRTHQVLDYALKQVRVVASSGETRYVFDTDIPDDTRSLIDGLNVMMECFIFGDKWVGVNHLAEGSPDRERFKTTFEKLGRALELTGIIDGRAWIRQTFTQRLLEPKFGGGRAASASSASASSATALPQQPQSTSFSPSMQPSTTQQPSPPEENEEALRLLAEASKPTLSVDELFSVLGQINVWLRRRGLAQEVVMDAARGKVVPTADEEEKIYLPHRTDDEGDASGGGGRPSAAPPTGWTKRMSGVYEQACVRFDLLKQQRHVKTEMEELLTLPNDQFVLALQDDLLSALFTAADDCCVAGEARRALEKRRDTLFTARVKVFHHNGEIRVVTVPQSRSFSELLASLEPWFPDIQRCHLSYLDDGDKVRVAVDQEYQELVKTHRLERVAATSGGTSSLGGTAMLGSSTMGSSQLLKGSAFIANREMACDVKLELYVDLPPKQSSAAAASPPPPPPPHPSATVRGERGGRSSASGGSTGRGGGLGGSLVHQQILMAEKPSSAASGSSQPAKSLPAGFNPSRILSDAGIERTPPSRHRSEPQQQTNDDDDEIMARQMQFIERRGRTLLGEGAAEGGTDASTNVDASRHSSSQQPQQQRNPPPLPPPPSGSSAASFNNSAAVQRREWNAPTSTNYWSLPGNIKEMEFAQHTVVGDDTDEIRIAQKEVAQMRAQESNHQQPARGGGGDGGVDLNRLSQPFSRKAGLPGRR